jgi:hypothetical protein
MQVDRFASPERRRVAACLDAGVERFQPPAGRETDRELVGERIDRRRVLDGVERGRRAFDGILPQPPVQEGAAGMVFAGTRPVQAIEGFQSLV